MGIDHQVPDHSKYQPGQEEGSGKAEKDGGPGQIDGGGEEVLEEAMVLLPVPRVGVDPPMLAHQPVPLGQVVHHTKHTGLLLEQLLPAGKKDFYEKTRSSWLNCALRDDEAVYWVSIEHYEAVAVGN